VACADCRYEQSFEEVMEFEDADPENIKNLEKYRFLFKKIYFHLFITDVCNSDLHMCVYSVCSCIHIFIKACSYCDCKFLLLMI